jgi:hypothetical protein
VVNDDVEHLVDLCPRDGENMPDTLPFQALHQQLGTRGRLRRLGG